MKILVAEDSGLARKFLTVELRKMQHEVIQAKDGREALDLYEKEQVPVIITDWEMPVMDGPELCRAVRELRLEPYTYIILLTARDGKENHIEGLNAGADDFITKPFDSDELEARLQVAARIVGLQTHVRRLESLLPICAYCKKIRDSGQQWVAVETYISERTDTMFSHGYCPECMQKYVEPELAALEEEGRRQRRNWTL